MTTTVDPNLTEQCNFLTVYQFCEVTGMSNSLVYKAIKEGNIKYFQLVKNGIKHIPISEVERFRGIGKCGRGRKEGQKPNPEKGKPQPEGPLPKTPSPEVINEAVRSLIDLSKLAGTFQRLCNALGERLVELGGEL